MKTDTSGYDDSRILVFVHIPKTAGTSLIKAISSGIGTPPSQPGFDRMLFGEFSDFASMSSHALKVIWPENSGFVTGFEKFVATHMGLSTLRAAYPEARFMTILREPVSRLLSHWLYWRVVPDSELEAWGRPWGDHVRISRQPLDQFLIAPEIAAQTDNLYLRTLVWPHPLVPNNGFIDPAHDKELLAWAIAKLKSLHFTGALEDPALQDRLSNWMGCGITLPRENIVRPLPPALKADFSSELTNASEPLGARSRLDTVLWRSALECTTKNIDALYVTSLLKSVTRLQGQLEND